MMSILSQHDDDPEHDSNDKSETKPAVVNNPLAMATFEIDTPISSSQHTQQTEEGHRGEDQYDHSLRAKMWTKEYIGLYSQYAAVGLMNGSLGMSQNLCVYYYEGTSNLCANANNIIQLAWSFKIVYAVITDSYRPFGMRRKPYMIAGWALVLIMLLVLACIADQLSGSEWIIVMMVCHCFLMVSDVPADGYSVELGQMEPPEQRGQILATGQVVHSIYRGCIQSYSVGQ
jgi:hypothetical protein